MRATMEFNLPDARSEGLSHSEVMFRLLRARPHWDGRHIRREVPLTPSGEVAAIASAIETETPGFEATPHLRPKGSPGRPQAPGTRWYDE